MGWAQWPDDTADAFSGANYWPDELPPQTFYEPSGRGFEARLQERLAHWDRLRRERSGGVD